MAIVRIQTLSAGSRDGGSTFVYETHDQRTNGSEFLLFLEVDNSQRTEPARLKAQATGLGAIDQVIPPGAVVRIPETGDISGFRIDGGREYYVEVS